MPASKCGASLKASPHSCVHMQRGCHLDFTQALVDAVKMAAERAEEIDDTLKTFMFVIPRVCPSKEWFTEIALHIIVVCSVCPFNSTNSCS